MIVHGVLSLDVGGLERIVVSMANRQHPSGVLCVEREGTLASQLNCQLLGCLSKPPGRHPDCIKDAEEFLRKCGATVLHTHQIGAAFYLAPAARQLGMRVVHTEHGNAFARCRSWFGRKRLGLLYRRVARHIHHFAAVSDDIARAAIALGGVPKEIVRVVPNGIQVPEPSATCRNIRESLGIAEDSYVIGSIGRLDEVKQQQILIDAVKATDGASLLLVGDGPERKKLEAKADRRIIFAGYQARPIDYLQAMDVFALSSRSEGFPVSLLEAWSVKRPAVVHAIGGLPDIIEDTVDGLLIDPVPPSTPRFVAAFNLLRDAGVRARLGEAGHAKLLERYTLATMLECYQELYGS